METIETAARWRAGVQHIRNANPWHIYEDFYTDDDELPHYQSPRSRGCSDGLSS